MYKTKFLTITKSNSGPTLLIGVFLLAVAVVAQTKTLHDFGNYYFGSLLFKLHLFNSEAYAPCSFNSTIEGLGYYNFLGTYYPFTPITTLFFYPFTFFKPFVAKFIFNILSIGTLLYALNIFFKHHKISSYYLIFLPIIFFVSIRNNIQFGQVYLIICSLILLTYVFYYQDKKWISALLLSIAIVIKISPALLLLFFLARKDYKHILRIVCCCSCLLAFSVMVNGFEIWSFYITEILKPFFNGAIGLDFKLHHQSAYILLKTMFVKNSVLNPYLILDNQNFFFIGVIVFKSLIISIGLILKKTINNNAIEFGIWIIIIVLLSPVGSTYALVLLLIPLLMVLISKLSNSKKIIITVITAVLVNISWNIFDSEIVILKFPRLIFLLVLFTLFIVYNFKTLTLKTFVLYIVGFCIIQKIISTNTKIEDNLVYGGKSIICDYNVKNDGIYVDEYSLEGIVSKKVNTKPKLIDKSNIEIKNNQIYLNNIQVTNDNSHKLKPLFIDGYIFYLTDIHQGYKFYSLKSLSVTKTTNYNMQ